MVPSLYFLLSAAGFPKESLMQVAASTALAAILFNSIASTWSHHKKRAIDFHALHLLFPGLLIGCIGGSALAHTLPSSVVRLIFGVVAALLGLYFFFPYLPYPRFAHKPNYTLAGWGLLVGLLSSMLGVGGGVVAIPFLLCYNMTMGHTVATASAVTLITSLLGNTTYLFIAWHHLSMPYTFGYIDLPALAILAPASLATAPLGAHLAHILPVPFLKRVFGAAVVLTGCFMILSGYTETS